MQTADIQSMQRRITLAGFPLVADGIWGPKSRSACQSHLRALMPSPNPWPASDEESLTRFFGDAGDESNLVSLPVAGLGVSYEANEVKSIRCHKRVAEPLGRVIEAIAATPHRGILRLYAGCYNFRTMRGSSRISTHARGIAIDLAPGWNGNATPWPEKATMPLEVMEMFAREGFKSAGAFWSRDAMHFEGTR